MWRPRIKLPFQMRISTLVLLTVIAAMGFAVYVQEQRLTRLRSQLQFATSPKEQAIRLFLERPRIVPAPRLYWDDAVPDTKSIPSDAGPNCVVVANVNGVLYLRIFDSSGTMIVDTDETKQPRAGRQIRDLKKQLAALDPEKKQAASDEEQVISTVESIVGFTPAPGTQTMSFDEFLRELNRVSACEKTIAGAFWTNGGHLPIYIDPVGLPEAQKTRTSAVTVPALPQPIGKTLSDVLKPLGMAYLIKDGMLMITSKEAVDKPLDGGSKSLSYRRFTVTVITRPHGRTCLA